VKRRIPQSADEWFHRAVSYLARFDRTAAQVERFLAGKGASPRHVSQVISRLSALRYLDDRAYGLRWVESALTRRPMGRIRLKNELMSRGLAEPLADVAILEGLQGIDEDTLARRALTLKSADRGSRHRTLSFLRQRGFGEDTIERIISDCFGEE